MTVSPDRPAVAVDVLRAAEEAVRERGLRLTSARRLVLQALFAARGPVSAEEIESRRRALTARPGLCGPPGPAAA